VSFVRKQLLVYIAIGIVVIAIGARFLFSGHSSSNDGAASGVALAAPSPPAAAASSASAAPSAPAEVVVDVAGAVVRPGVYRLPSGARVCDALDLAGGTTARAQTAAVNLAARLVDGQQIVIPEKGPAGSPAGTGVPAAGAGAAVTGPSGSAGTGPAMPVNLNTATLEQLDTLSGVGPSTAQKIIDYREQNGGFRSVDELQEVSGIGDVKFAALKDLVTI
jgi:competence protein ComEA